MDDKARALEALKEIPLPVPISYMPQTVGWLIIAVGIAVALACLAFRLYRHYRANQYRRDALAQLNGLERELADPAQRARAILALPVLVKRTALSFAPRERVASLTGGEWLAFLDSTSAPGQFTRGPGQMKRLIAALCLVLAAVEDGSSVRCRRPAVPAPLDRRFRLPGCYGTTAIKGNADALLSTLPEARKVLTVSHSSARLGRRLLAPLNPA